MIAVIDSLAWRWFGILVEPRMVRKPGRFELCLGAAGIATKLIWSGDDSEDDWPWMIHLQILWLKIFLHLPIPWKPSFRHDVDGFGWSSFGFMWIFREPTVHLHWGETKVVWLPWMWEQVRHEVLRPDGSWVPFVGSWERDKEPDERKEATYPYRYVLKSGEVQDRKATIYVERRARRMRWMKWTGLLERETQAIGVKFDLEVGERTGSWKGGCIGCGYAIRRGESPLEALRRMERERGFGE